MAKIYKFSGNHDHVLRLCHHPISYNKKLWDAKNLKKQNFQNASLACIIESMSTLFLMKLGP